MKLHIAANERPVEMDSSQLKWNPKLEPPDRPRRKTFLTRTDLLGVLKTYGGDRNMWPWVKFHGIALVKLQLCVCVRVKLAGDGVAGGVDGGEVRRGEEVVVVRAAGGVGGCYSEACLSLFVFTPHEEDEFHGVI
ncbi:hypothetical protein A4A49_01596 [Nicotiana attenuata]|uniref:Uncharacterized protein n=1 Tax=Nicotiana attenuata TaxID=49451 RepID=A0A1J6I6J4_NICAT|nr:hypothetical protein A4A49_01596 [Nicotiana attenuata]